MEGVEHLAKDIVCDCLISLTFSVFAVYVIMDGSKMFHF